MWVLGSSASEGRAAGPSAAGGEQGRDCGSGGAATGELSSGAAGARATALLAAGMLAGAAYMLWSARVERDAIAAELARVEEQRRQERAGRIHAEKVRGAA